MGILKILSKLLVYLHMETAFFWIIWGLISLWVLKTFYFSYDQVKLHQLRQTAFGLNLAVLTLTFLPWLPPTLGGDSGLGLALRGNILAGLFFGLLIISLLLFLTKVSSNLKIAALATMINSFVLFTLMIQLQPRTFALSFYDMAPIVTVLCLLANDVIVLLLWQQLQLAGKRKRK